jgi:molybdopterin molybdotransferase
MKNTLLSVSEAREELLKEIKTVGSEEIDLQHAANRVLAQDVIARSDLPPFTNSSMDGFAVRSQDFTPHTNNPVVLKLITDIPAGLIPDIELQPGQAARIMTGAVLPKGADSVVPIENTDHYSTRDQHASLTSDHVTILQPVEAGAFIRRQGEDQKKGAMVLKTHCLLRPQELGLLAMLGISQVTVYKKPKIYFFSSGDELVPVDEGLKPGRIHDSNSYTLAAQIHRDGGIPGYLGIVPDQEETIRRCFEQAHANGADMIVSTAGVSMGAYDYVRVVLEKYGQLRFWKVNIRPGKPIAFGAYKGIPFFGLPGNPGSSFVGYEVFIHPALEKLAGKLLQERFSIKVRLLGEFESDGRETYLRAVIEERNGEWVAHIAGHQGSGNLLSLVQANALLIIPSGVKSVPFGTLVDAWLLDR